MNDLSRRDLRLGAGGVTLAQLMACASPPTPAPATPKNAANPAPPPGLVLGYFAQFGIDEKMFREGLAAALSRGADRADLYFEHKVSTSGNSSSTTGVFSLGLQGFRVVNGQKAEPLSEMNLSGKHIDFWSKLVATGNDPFVYSNVRTPSLMFDGASIAGI